MKGKWEGSDAVRRLSAGAGDVSICDECIARCQQLIVVAETSEVERPEMPVQC